MENNKPNKFGRLWKEKGYYILLSLCLIAVGVSGYLFLSGAAEEDRQLQPVLSIPVEVETSEQVQTPPEQAVPETDKEQEPSAPTAQPEEAPLTVMPVSGTVLQDYAMDRLTYNETTRDWRVHGGVDLAAEAGTPVKAAKAGTVSTVFEDSGYGTTVVINHDGGYTSHYCNLDAEVSVAAGDTVAAGDVIGTVGATALLERAEDPHLHFAVFENGQPVDPAGFLY